MSRKILNCQICNRRLKLGWRYKIAAMRETDTGFAADGLSLYLCPGCYKHIRTEIERKKNHD